MQTQASQAQSSKAGGPHQQADTPSGHPASSSQGYAELSAESGPSHKIGFGESRLEGSLVGWQA